MTRFRGVLLAALLVASAVLAGCAGSDAGSTPATASPTSDAARTTTTDGTASSTTALSTPPVTRLVVEARGVENLTVTVWNSSLPNGDPVYDQTFRQPDGTLFFDHAFERPVSYHAEIRANGTVVVNRTLHASEGYRVSVTPNGTDVATVET